MFYFLWKYTDIGYVIFVSTPIVVMMVVVAVGGREVTGQLCCCKLIEMKIRMTQIP